jgi:hypothetical protein
MPIDPFTGGSESARDKLNELVRQVNALSIIRGDNQFIAVHKGPGGSTVSLNIDAVVARVPRYVPDGAGQLHLGIVRSPGANGTASSTYVANVYGTSIASLSDSPTETSVTVTQTGTPLVKYWWGEIVGLMKVGGSWVIQKFLSLPMAYTVAAGQICVRLLDPTGATATNFLADLYDCLTWFGEDGSNDATGYATFSFGAYGGLGAINKTCAPTLYDGAWNIVDDLAVTATLATAVAALVSGSPTTVADSQDTSTALGALSGSGTTHGAWGNATVSIPGDGSYRWAYTAGEQTTYSGTVVTLAWFLDGSGEAAAFPDCPALPSIPFGSDNAMLLLGYYRASIRCLNIYNLSGYSVTRVYPNIQADRPIAAGGSTVIGAYSQNVKYPTNLGTGTPGTGLTHVTDLAVS